MKEIIEAVRCLYAYLACEGWVSMTKADLIFVCGNFHEGPALQAAKLYQEERATKILITGLGPKKDQRHPGLPPEFASEAAYYRSILLEQEVPEEAILVEDQSTNTWENVVFGLRLAEKHHLQLNSVLICAVPILLRRAAATFFKVRQTTWPFPAYYLDPRFEENNLQGERIIRMLGEIERLASYAEKGDIVETEIPENVMSAVEILRKNYQI